MGFRDIFRLIPASELANLADVFSRNAIFSANDWRQILGRKPSDDPGANELSNKNMPQPQLQTPRVNTQPLKQDFVEKLRELPKEEIRTLIDSLERDLNKQSF